MTPTMPRFQLIAIMLAASSAVAHAQKPTDAEIKAAAKKLADKKRDNDRKLNDAFARSDPAAFAALAGSHIKLRGLWFPTEECRDRFGGRAEVAKADVDALATCLFELKLKVVENRGVVHEPGVTLFPRWEHDTLTGLSNTEIDPAAPTIDPEVFDKHAKRKLDVKRDKKTAELMKANTELAIVIDVRACVDKAGKLDALAVTGSDANDESYRAAVEKAAKTWSFKPFKHRGKAIRVCTLRQFVLYDGDGLLGGEVGGFGNDDPVPTPPPPMKR